MLPTREEFRSALRTLRRSPGFVVVATFSLGLAIALNTTMFAVVDALLFPQYPVKQQSQLYLADYRASYETLRRGRQAWHDATERATDLLEHADFFESGARIAWAGGQGLQIDMPGASVLASGAHVVSLNFFAVAGMKPLLGRFFSPAESEAADRGYVVISRTLWRRLYNNRSTFEPFNIDMGGKSYTVIGVLPDRAERAFSGDVFIAWQPRADQIGSGMLVRAKPGFTEQRIKDELARLNSRLAREQNTNPGDSQYDADNIAKPGKLVQGLQIALVAAVIAVLLIACANISNLQIARGLGRARELAVRAAIGAGRAQLIRLLVVESAILGAVGAGIGLMLSLWGIGGLRQFIPPSVERLGFIDPQLSWRVFLFATVAMVVTILLFGLLPAIRVSRVNIDDVLKSGAGTSVTRRARRQYSLLIIAEIAGALVLFAGATLLASAARSLHTYDLGYDPRQLIAASAAFRAGPPGTPGARQQARAMLDAVKARPEVEAASLRWTANYDSETVSVDDPTRPRAQFHMPMFFASYSIVTSDFFRTFGIPIIHGSDFALNDDGQTPSVIVDSVAAARWWPGVNPVGRMIKFGPLGSKHAWIRVVGVSRTARFAATEDDPEPMAFLIRDMRDTSLARPGIYNYAINAGIIARVRGDPRLALVDLRQHYGGFNRLRIAVLWDEASGLHSLRQSHDFIALVFVLFATFGLALAMIGIYGVVSHSVAQRTREFGVRFALGANTGQVIGMVVHEGNTVTLLGVAGGLLLTYWSIHLIQYFLFGVEGAMEAFVLTLAPLAMYGAATLASWAPAVRASRVNPVEALRND